MVGGWGFSDQCSDKKSLRAPVVVYNLVAYMRNGGGGKPSTQ